MEQVKAGATAAAQPALSATTTAHKASAAVSTASGSSTAGPTTNPMPAGDQPALLRNLLVQKLKQAYRDIVTTHYKEVTATSAQGIATEAPTPMPSAGTARFLTVAGGEDSSTVVGGAADVAVAGGSPVPSEPVA